MPSPMDPSGRPFEPYCKLLKGVYVGDYRGEYYSDYSGYLGGC